MMDSYTIENLARKAARDSARLGKEPAILSESDLGNLRRGRGTGVRIPFIGDRVPRGWKLVNVAEWFPDLAYPGERGVYPEGFRGKGVFFVDTSGFGRTGESALTLEQFAEMARPGYGYAMIEAGQFQGHIAAFERRH
jgi:hypothetical protein